MTKEEAKEILISTLRDINSDDNIFEYTTEQFSEAMLIAIESLSNPSLPSNLDEAAKEFEDKAMNDYDDIFVTEDGVERPVLKYKSFYPLVPS